MITIQNLHPQFPITGKTEEKKTFLPCFAKSPTDFSISMLVSLKIRGSKYKIESFKTPIFGSIFLFCNTTTSNTFPVKIKPNMMVRILLKSVLEFLSPARRTPQEHTESTMILRLIPTDLSEAKTLSCTLFHTAGE